MSISDFMDRYLQLADTGQIEEEFIGMKEIRLYLKGGEVITIASRPVIRKAILAKH
jgi:hypothetical protein